MSLRKLCSSACIAILIACKLVAPARAESEAVAPVVPAGAAVEPAVTLPSSARPTLSLPNARPTRNAPLWLSADYLLWWLRGADLPALVTSSPAGTPFANAGALGQSTTTTVFGDEAANDQLRSGLRFRGGLWLDAQQTHAIEFDYFRLENKNDTFQAASDGTQIFARPFTDALTGLPNAEMVSYAGVIQGGVDVSSYSQGLRGWGTNFRSLLAECCCSCSEQRRLDLLWGYRQLRYGDQLDIQERLTSPLFAAGTQLIVADHFAATNAFYGGDLGLAYTHRKSRWQWNSYGRVALGANQSRVHINGATTVVSPDGSIVSSSGGLMALSSNIGTYEVHRFASIWEVGWQGGYWVSDRLMLHAGYTFLYWPGIYRAYKQVDTAMNPNLLPPAIIVAGDPQRPAATLTDNDFWAQGINLGATLRY